MPPMLKPSSSQLLLPEARVLPELLDALRLFSRTSNAAMQVAATEGGCDVENRNGRRAMIEELDEVAGAADIAAERADSLRQRADLDIYAAVHIEMVDGAAAVAAQHAGGVRVIDHHDGAIFFGEVAERGQRADVAVHGEDAVGDQQPLAGLVLDAGQLLFGVGGVLVAKTRILARDRRAPSMMRGVVQLVGDDEVFFAEHRRDRAGIGGEAGLKDHAGFDVLEARDLLFQLHVDLHGAGDSAHRA